jgi:thiamine-phosphate pyrophosphorylase
MNVIVITYPNFLQNENEYISSLFDAGLEILHLRKPNATKEEYERLLNAIPQKYHKRIMLHDFFELTEKYDVRGVHFNRRNPEYNRTKNIKISKSCHSIWELEMIDRFDYVFLSPVFDSVSKEGYCAAFSHEELLCASEVGLINEKVIALGGIDVNRLPLLEPYNFGGIGTLGTVWDVSGEERAKRIVERFLEIQKKWKNVTFSPSCPWRNNFPFQFITHQTDKYDYFQSAQLALEGGCKWIQLRMKEASTEEIELMALRIKPLCKKENATFIIDDHVEICKKTGADGVHLGKNDMPPAEARKILENQFIIGGTCNTYEDILTVKDHVDYIGCGPFRFTTTKKNLAPTLGLDGYRNIAWNCRSNGINTPIVAIGGITADDIPDIFNAGANGVALSGTILNAEKPKTETERIVKTIISCKI